MSFDFLTAIVPIMFDRYLFGNRFLNVCFLFFFFASPVFYASGQQTSAYRDDVQSLEAAMDALLETISGPAGRNIDWDRFRNLFRGDVPFYIRSKRNEEWRVLELSVERYISDIGPNLEKRNFFEVASNLHVSRYGDIASVFMVYESRENPSDAAPFDRGINSLQLMFDGERWWIVSLIWQAESTGVAIPKVWLKKNKNK